MAKLLVLASGVVEPGAGETGELSAFVAYNPKPGVSRLFKVWGPVDGPHVTELPSATTVDLGAFRLQLEAELQPALSRIIQSGGHGAITTPKPDWVVSWVQSHLDSVGEGGGV